MTAMVLEQLVKQTETLTTDELLHLIASLADRARQRTPTAPRRRKWREICGIAPYPLVGEDAQRWVSRTRQEADAQRERQWRRDP
ncbi:MAG: hypothetical protein ABI874_02960 [Chloroflexota bacterium]